MSAALMLSKSAGMVSLLTVLAIRICREGWLNRCDIMSRS